MEPTILKYAVYLDFHQMSELSILNFEKPVKKYSNKSNYYGFWVV